MNSEDQPLSPSATARAIRLQLLNSICRAIGARRRFYQLVSQDSLFRAEGVEDLLKRTRRAFRRTRILRPGVRRTSLDRLDHTHKSFNAGQTGQMLETIGQCATYLENHVGEDTVASATHSFCRPWYKNCV